MLIIRFFKTLDKNWLDAIAVTAWGALLVSYWLNGSLSILIHPSYFWLAAFTGFALLIIGSIKAYLIYQYPQSQPNSTGHVSLLPGNWAIGLLLVTAIAGLLITPRVFTSSKAIQGGVTENSTITRSQPQSFRSQVKPEQRSLVDWVRTLSAYPEPDTYSGQKANVSGFVVNSPDLSAQYLLLSRFVITCCAADVYPVSLTVKLPAKLPGSEKIYKPDTWLQVSGQMATESLANNRQLVLIANDIKPIDTPRNPYEY
jgi:uncharacterized repeat protein (TIGR03943 family)